jgi:hypothetical protein
MARLGLLGEQVAGLTATVTGVSTRVTEVRDDAREARDTAQRLAAKLDGQEIPAQLERLHGEIAAGVSGLRSDMTNTYARLKADMLDADGKLAGRVDGHDMRLDKLEAWRTKLEGGASVFGWLSKNAPWLITVVAAIAVIFGLKAKGG